MWLLGIGIVLLGLRLLGVGWFATLSWWWVALPFLLAAVWWELLERLLGRDRRLPFDEIEKSRRNRIAHGLDTRRHKRGLLRR